MFLKRKKIYHETRTVFNGSAKLDSRLSINAMLLPEPNLLPCQYWQISYWQNPLGSTVEIDIGTLIYAYLPSLFHANISTKQLPQDGMHQFPQGADDLRNTLPQIPKRIPKKRLFLALFSDLTNRL